MRKANTACQRTAIGARRRTMETKIESGQLLEANRPPSFWTRGRLVSLYTTAVTALGVTVLVLALSQIPEDAFGVALFASMAAIAELTSVELFVSSRRRASA